MARMGEPPAATTSFLRVEVRTRPGFPDATARKISEQVRRLLERDAPVEVVRGYSLAFAPAALPRADDGVGKLHAVLADPVLQETTVLAADAPVPAAPAGMRRVDVLRRPGVMDPAADS